MKATPYTSEELVDMLKARRGELTLEQFAAEISQQVGTVSYQMLSDIFRGTRSVGNKKVLKYLAGKKKRFEHRDAWYLVKE